MKKRITELLNIKEYSIVFNNAGLDWKKSKNGKPEFGGIYAFWWKDNSSSLIKLIQNDIFFFSGPNNVQLKLVLNNELIETASNGFVPLYIGKNAKDISSRIGQHLLLKTKRLIPETEVNTIKRKKGTSCQVRDRIDRLFPKISDTREIIREYLAISYVKIDGINNFTERFFLEDYAIGEFKPFFNIDSER